MFNKKELQRLRDKVNQVGLAYNEVAFKLQQQHVHMMNQKQEIQKLNEAILRKNYAIGRLKELVTAEREANKLLSIMLKTATPTATLKKSKKVNK